MRSTLFTLLVVSLLLAGTHAFAWSGGFGMRGAKDCNPGECRQMTDDQSRQRRDQHFEKMAVILDLNDNQQQKLTALREGHMQQQQALRAEMQSLREQLRQAGADGTFNESEFRAAALQQAELKTQMMAQRAEARRQMTAVLTPEQQQKAEQLMDMRGERSYGKGGCYPGGNCAGGDDRMKRKADRRCGQGPRG